MALTILCVSFTLLLLLGVPVAFSIGLSSLATILYEGLPLAVGFQQMISDEAVLVPGDPVLHLRRRDHDVRRRRRPHRRLRQALAGHVRGGLGMTNVLACTLFGGVSGSPVADVSAMGAVLIPQMKKEGYHADYAVNVTTHASLVGALMPTSHNMIIFTLAAGVQVSIAALILAGIVPAIILTSATGRGLRGGGPAATSAGSSGLGHRRPVLRGLAAGAAGGGDHHRGHPLRRLHRHRIGLGGGGVSAVPLGGGLSQADARAVPQGRCQAVKTTGTVLLLIGISSMFGYLIGAVRRGRAHRPGARRHDQPAVGDLPVVNVILFVLGTFLDMAATILICTPIFLPICQRYGMTTCSSASSC